MLRPIRDRVLIKRDTTPEQSITNGGIYIPLIAQERTQEATVMAIGSEVTEVKPGDRILVGKQSATGTKFKGEDGDEWQTQRERDIIAVLG